MPLQLQIDCTVKGIDEVFRKLEKMGSGEKVQVAVKSVALELSRKLKEVHPKGHYGRYGEDGDFIERRQGGYSRNAWRGPLKTGPLSFQLLNPVQYVENIFYAIRRQSDVVDSTYRQPGRSLTSVFDYVCQLFQKKLGAAIHQAVREQVQ